MIGCLREVLHAPSEPERVVARIADPRVHVVTLTITEAGYASPVVDLLARGLRGARRGARSPCSRATTCRATARCSSGSSASATDERHVTFPCSVVDRITPATTDADRAAAARLTGFEDRAAVVTEPFRQWVIEDRFAGPRPAWERAGAQLVADSAPYEQLKLRVLNGSHSMLAYLGLLAGARTVDEAVRDEAIAGAVRATGRRGRRADAPAGLDLPAYRAALAERFANPRMAHRLEQIAADGSQKLPARLLRSGARAARRGRRAALGRARGRGVGAAPARRRRARRGRRAAARGAGERRHAAARPADAVLRALDPELAADPGLP